MNESRWRALPGTGLIAVVAGLLLAPPAAGGKDKNDLELDKMPKQVMVALKKKFPEAEIHEWTKEKEGDIVVYDIEFEQDGRKFEADIEENGAIHNWEREIESRDLPEVVRKTVETKYPKAVLEEIMAITAVKDGKDVLEGYEITLETAQKRAVEVTVAPDGKVLEESEDEE
jgi:uncharacterized membrane protein YkoI